VVTLLGRNSLTLSGGFVYVVPITSSFAIKSLVLNYGHLPIIQIATDNIPKNLSHTCNFSRYFLFAVCIFRPLPWFYCFCFKSNHFWR